MSLVNFANDESLGRRADKWADALLFGPPNRVGSFPFGPERGVIGVGIVRHGRQDTIVFVAPLPSWVKDAALKVTALHSMESNREIGEAVLEALPGEKIGDAAILYAPPMIRNAQARTAIISTMQGTAGPEATWGNGRRGFLTAGHVVIGSTGVNDVNGNSLGSVVCAFDPSSAGSGTRPNVDVGLVEVLHTAATTKYAQGSPIAAGRTNVDLHLGSGKQSAVINGKMSWYAPAAGGIYSDVYMTGQRCTSSGDSGAMATDVSNDAIGLLLGASAGIFTSYIQDIQTQVTALRGATGLSGLAL